MYLYFYHMYTAAVKTEPTVVIPVCIFTKSKVMRDD